MEYLYSRIHTEKLRQPAGTRKYSSKPMITIGTPGEDDGVDMTLPPSYGDTEIEAKTQAQADLDEWLKTKDLSKLM